MSLCNIHRSTTHAVQNDQPKNLYRARAAVPNTNCSARRRDEKEQIKKRSKADSNSRGKRSLFVNESRSSSCGPFSFPPILCFGRHRSFARWPSFLRPSARWGEFRLPNSFAFSCGFLGFYARTYILFLLVLFFLLEGFGAPSWSRLIGRRETDKQRNKNVCSLQGHHHSGPTRSGNLFFTLDVVRVGLTFNITS